MNVGVFFISARTAELTRSVEHLLLRSNCVSFCLSVFLFVCRSVVRSFCLPFSQGLNRTDPEAVWSFQGWAFIGWKSEAQGEFINGFVEATPKGKFNVIDMSVNGAGEWAKWNDSR